ncbi:hypothetical protein BKA67DRAFT_554913 [Truncatella angustata]|uniref:2EXR domain-containing protein n=1 Tax=Truncatella angustata TaxID=152316 RepID=A0A9P8USC4_9PEZI|nr:uncharacterized protein BKA67DRAFT_554913 [Truncatella angustata]KAH6657301.1 hypothetical protein BKA67DRAFT_554913 [Truncatella angustata]
MSLIYFDQLPEELRLKIWEDALEDEYCSRLVFFCAKTGTLLPTRNLVSPLLIVNQESRECALTERRHTVIVYKIPPAGYKRNGTQRESLLIRDCVPAGCLRVNLKREHFIEHPTFLRNESFARQGIAHWNCISTTRRQSSIRRYITAPLKQDWTQCEHFHKSSGVSAVAVQSPAIMTFFKSSITSERNARLSARDPQYFVIDSLSTYITDVSNVDLDLLRLMDRYIPKEAIAWKSDRLQIDFNLVR